MAESDNHQINNIAAAKGIKYFYNRQDDLKLIGKIGQDLVKDQYTWDAQAEKLLEYLNHILDN